MTIPAHPVVSRLLLTASCLWLLTACGDSPPKTTTITTTTEAHAHAENIVALTPEQVRAAGIETAPVASKNLGVAVKVNGTLEVPAQNKAVVTALYSGILQTLRIHPGGHVEKGQVLGTVVNTEVIDVQQQLISVNAQLKLAELEYRRQQELVAGNAAPLKNLQKAEAERSSLRAQQTAVQRQLSALGISPAAVAGGRISSTLSIKAPITGTISDIHAQIGSKVDAATPVAEIVNNSRLHLDLFVYENDLPQIREGQIIHFTLTHHPGREYDAKIFSVGTAFADETKAVPVHAEVMGDKTGLIEGMAVTAIISIGTRTAPAVPTDAIASHDGNDYIFLAIREQEAAHNHTSDAHAETDHHHGEPAESVRFRRIQVVRGVSDLGHTEIQPVEALPQGARIVTKGAFFVMAAMTNEGEGHAH